MGSSCSVLALKPVALAIHARASWVSANWSSCATRLRYSLNMYQPPHNVEDRELVMHQLIRTYPLGLLISGGREGLLANHIPFVLSTEAGEPAVLECHLALANQQWREFEGGAPCLVVFQGPQAYVTPSWYPAKQEHGKVVPTWNYVVVQVRGTAHTVSDRDWLLRHLNELTNENETAMKDPWKVSDAPSGYVNSQMKGIKGLRIEVSAMAGKWKTSQNRSLADRYGVVKGLSELGGEADDVAQVMNSQLAGEGQT